MTYVRNAAYSNRIATLSLESSGRDAISCSLTVNDKRPIFSWTSKKAVGVDTVQTDLPTKMLRIALD
jgi:hypothetical protein